MGSRVRCPHCGHTFDSGARRDVVQCPECRKYLKAAGSGAPPRAPSADAPPQTGSRAETVATPPPIAPIAPIAPVARVARVAPAAPVPPAAPKTAPSRTAAAPTLHRTCPVCNERYPVTEHVCPACGTRHATATAEREAVEGSAFAAEKKGIAAGVVGGLTMIGIAVVWFVGGYMAGYIFYYPPVLAVIGLWAVVKGLATGNLNGERRSARRRGR